MNIRLRIIGDQEQAESSQFVLVVAKSGYPQETAFAVLEYEYGEGSAEGTSWAPIEVYNDL